MEWPLCPFTFFFSGTDHFPSSFDRKNGRKAAIPYTPIKKTFHIVHIVLEEATGLRLDKQLQFKWVYLASWTFAATTSRRTRGIRSPSFWSQLQFCPSICIHVQRLCVRNALDLCRWGTLWQTCNLAPASDSTKPFQRELGGKVSRLSCKLHLHLDVFAQHNVVCVRVFVYPSICVRILLVGDNVDVWAEIKGGSHEKSYRCGLLKSYLINRIIA